MFKIKWTVKAAPVRAVTAALDESVLKPRMEESVKLLCERARQICPVRTGRLRASLTWEVLENGRVGWYGSNRPWRGEQSVPYAVFIEKGFVHWKSKKFIPGRAYLRGPLVSEWPKIVKIWSGRAPGATTWLEVKY